MGSLPSPPSPLLQRLSQVIHGDAAIDDFERYVYASPEMEGELGARDYHELLAFDYRGRHARHELLKLLTAVYERRRPGMLLQDRVRLLAEGLCSGSVELDSAVGELAMLWYAGREWIPSEFVSISAFLDDLPHSDEYANWHPDALRAQQPEWDARRETVRADAVNAARELLRALDAPAWSEADAPRPVEDDGMPRPSRRWVPRLLLALGLFVAALCASGYSMAASFSVANPGRLTHWRMIATLYFFGILAGMSIAFASVIYLLRTRGRP
jgi:hypothetical protein